MRDSPGQMAAVQVAIRIRPLTDRDRAQPRFSNSEVLRAHEKHVQVVSQNKYFTFDHVFGQETIQEDIFYQLGQKPVQKFTEGYNVTMLAYGQTSSGKTYTMGTAQHTNSIDPEEEGIVPRAMALLFDILQQQHYQQNENNKNIRSQQKLSYRYSVKVSFVEIYNEDLIDLLNPALPSEKPPVTIREDTKGHIYWTGVKEVTVNNTHDVLYYLQQGTENRATGSTDMNEKSSRSHAIFSVTLKQERWVPSSSPQSSRAASPVTSKLQQQSKIQSKLSPISKSNSLNNVTQEDGEWIITNSKFHFVDLAGSERLKRTAAEGDRRKEGININAGLLALGNVISALGDPSKKSTHVPYRDSKLTRLLQDSLGGSAMTLMIACVSPAESNLSETLNTLQYANRARNIKNKMEKNEMEEWMTTDNLDMLRNMITKLKNELRSKKSSDFNDNISSSSSPIVNPDYDDLYHDQHVIIADLKQQVEELNNAAQFANERNAVVEKELIKLQNQQQPSDFDFQHLVEPVIEEYEKSISGLESQLAMIRAALNHSDQGYEEQQAKIEQCETVIENQEKNINELKRRNGKLVERRMKDENYISELEKKLMVAVEEAVHDREMLSELRGKILKLKEVDENTEQYIHDLEGRLTQSELERTELKEKLNKLMSSTKEDAVENQEEKVLVDKEHQRQLKELHNKLELSEKDRLQLQSQIDQLLFENASIEETNRKTSDQSNKDLIHQKDMRIRELESNLANLQHDHQDTLKELDEVLIRYQEVLDGSETTNHLNGTNSEDEVKLLRQSIQHLEHELDLASKRERIFRQMSEDNRASVEVEKTLLNLEVSEGDDITQQTAEDHILLGFQALQRKFEHLNTELQLRNIRIQCDNDQDDLTQAQDSKGNSVPDLHARYESQLMQYKQELKNLTRILKDIKKAKANETKVINPNMMDSEHRMLLKNIAGLDKQLTEQYEKLKFEAKRFSNDVVELISLNNDLENELEILRDTDNSSSGSPSLQKNSNRNSMLRPPTNYSNKSQEEDINNDQNQVLQASSNLINEYKKNRHAIQTRLSIAQQDLKLHQTVIYALEHKFKNSEIILNTFRKRLENETVTEIEIEELRFKMDAMKLQLESTEKMKAVIDN